MGVHVTIDELQAYIQSVLNSLAAGTIVTPGNLLGGLTAGSGGVPATPASDGLYDAFNRSDSGNGSLGTTDFGGLVYTYGPGTPQWVIGLDHRAKSAPGGAAAILDVLSVNQHFRASVKSTGTTPGQGCTIRLRETSTGGGGHYRVTFLYDTATTTVMNVSSVSSTGVVINNLTGNIGVPHLFDGADHIIEVDINVYDFVVTVDRTASYLVKDAAGSDSAGTCVGFEQNDALLSWDNISILPQMLYDQLGGGSPSSPGQDQSVGAVTRYNELQAGNIGTARFPGGYGAYVSNLGGGIVDFYGNGIEAFVGGRAGGVIDLAQAIDLEAFVGYSAQNFMEPEVFLRWVDANNWLRVRATVGNSGGLYIEKCVTGTITMLASSNTGGLSVNGILQAYLRNGVITGICPAGATPRVISYTLLAGDVPSNILTSTKVGVGSDSGQNYSVLSTFSIIPL